MILLVCSLLLGGCKDIVTPMQNLFVCTDEMEKNYSCSKTGNPDAVYNTYQTHTIGDHTYSVQIDGKGKIVDAIELNK